MSRDYMFVKVVEKGMDNSADYCLAINLDIVKDNYESMMGEKFPLIKIDCSDYFDVSVNNPRIKNEIDRLKVISEFGYDKVDVKEISDKIFKFWDQYNTQIDINNTDRMDCDCDVLLYNLARRLCPNGYVFYCE